MQHDVVIANIEDEFIFGMDVLNQSMGSSWILKNIYGNEERGDVTARMVVAEDIGD